METLIRTRIVDLNTLPYGIPLYCCVGLVGGTPYMFLDVLESYMYIRIPYVDMRYIVDLHFQQQHWFEIQYILYRY